MDEKDDQVVELSEDANDFVERMGKLELTENDVNKVTKEKIYSALQTCLKIADISTWSKECTSIIDGFGTQRIVNAISQRISKKMVGGY